MNRVQGVSPSRAGAWSVFHGQRIGAVTGSTRVQTLTGAPHATSHGLCRSIPPAQGKFPGSRARYNLHNQDVRDSVRG